MRAESIEMSDEPEDLIPIPDELRVPQGGMSIVHRYGLFEFENDDTLGEESIVSFEHYKDSAILTYCWGKGCYDRVPTEEEHIGLCDRCLEEKRR